MGTYNKIVGRSQTGEQLIPPEQVKAILQDTPKSSVVLDKAVSELCGIAWRGCAKGTLGHARARKTPVFQRIPGLERRRWE